MSLMHIYRQRLVYLQLVLTDIHQVASHYLLFITTYSSHGTSELKTTEKEEFDY